jgi:hypothetical protein
MEAFAEAGATVSEEARTAHVFGQRDSRVEIEARRKRQ